MFFSPPITNILGHVFLAVQDSSIGDLVTHWLSECVSQWNFFILALQWLQRLQWLRWLQWLQWLRWLQWLQWLRWLQRLQWLQKKGHISFNTSFHLSSAKRLRESFNIQNTILDGGRSYELFTLFSLIKMLKQLWSKTAILPKYWMGGVE